MTKTLALCLAVLAAGSAHAASLPDAPTCQLPTCQLPTCPRRVAHLPVAKMITEP